MNFQSRIFLVCVFVVIACVEPYSIDFKQTFNILLVEAELTDSDEPQRIHISNSQYIFQSLSKKPVRGLFVEIEINGKLKLQLHEASDGAYVFPENFKPKIGDTFRLFFQKTDGRKYESGLEKLSASPNIDKVYNTFERTGGNAFGKIVPSHNIYVDFKDTDASNNFYSWTWTLWEKQNICFSNDFYDLYCEKACYEILKNEKIEILDDRFYNGKSIVGRVVANIPYYQNSGALLLLKQNAITVEAYKFYKQLQDLTQNNGTLADTPPPIIGGNIKCVSDESEIVVGMFMVKGVTSKYYWLDRENAEAGVLPIGLLGREPQSPKGGGNLTTPCVLLENRTPVKPKNWME